MNAEFAPTLQRQMNAFNSDPPGDSLQVFMYCRVSIASLCVRLGTAVDADQASLFLVSV